MPDFQDRVIQGSGTRGNVGTYKTESLPNITGNLVADVYVDGSGCFEVIDNPYGGETSGNNNNAVSFDASRSSSTYQTDAPVQQNALLIQCCIKY